MIKCTNSTCDDYATKVMAWMMGSGDCAFVAPYCDKHANEVAKEQGALSACGPALSEDAQMIDGIRR